jgi:hypothetical protein
MQAPALLKNLVSALGDCRQNDFLMLFLGALDCNDPVLKAPSGMSVHSSPHLGTHS